MKQKNELNISMAGSNAAEADHRKTTQNIS
jgi:hypothetical protein